MEVPIPCKSNFFIRPTKLDQVPKTNTICYIVLYCNRFIILFTQVVGFPRSRGAEESACQCGSHRRCGFDSWVGEETLEKGVAIHSSILAWRIPWTEKPGRLQFVGSQRVRHNWATNTHTQKVRTWYSRVAKGCAAKAHEKWQSMESECDRLDWFNH